MEASYLIFAISNFVLYVFYDTVYMYLTDYALGVGVSADDSANLISVIGILNCLGTVLMGYVGDRTWSSPVILYNVSMVICGLSIISMPFITNYWLLAMTSGVFGLFISANYALTSVILVELVSLEAFSKTYGMLLLIQGVANLIGPPLVSRFYFYYYIFNINHKEALNT
ncbi:monocarboxylate transporter 9-like [Cherax quadricarinatus]|uniref:monocarboxylate transporter 9-like n=1 Tax=Cherax quadricarinatus TaxID=27406 RepID=UPI00387E72C7